MSIIAAYLVCARSAAALLADEAVASRWDAPSALEHYTVAGLAGHLAGQIWVVEKVLDGPPPQTEPIPLHRYFAQTRWLDAPHEGEVHTGIRTSGETASADGPAELAARAARALRSLEGRLPAERPDRVVQFPWGPPALRSR